MNVIEIINTSASVLGIAGFGFGIWKYKTSSDRRKIINDSVKRLYKDSKQLLEKSRGTIQEDDVRSMKKSIIQVDIANRNLSSKKISRLIGKGIFSENEADEYKKLVSN